MSSAQTAIKEINKCRLHYIKIDIQAYINEMTVVVLIALSQFYAKSVQLFYEFIYLLLFRLLLTICLVYKL